MLQTNAGQFQAGSTSTAPLRVSHDFSQTPLLSKSQAHIQAKLTIGAPDNVYEQEADRISEQVMGMAEPQLQRACDGTYPQHLMRQRKQLSQAPEILQAKRTHVSGGGQNLAPSIVNETLTGVGQPLNRSTRDFMEPRFDHDFSQVRVHAGNLPAQSANSISARAYTVGKNIVFNRGEYAPDTHNGKKLLAHELTHVIQQGSASRSTHQTSFPTVDSKASVTKLTTANAAVQRATWEEVLGEMSEDQAAASINEVLGIGAYDDWMTLEAAHNYEMKRARVNLARFSAFKESSGAIYLERDAERVGRAMLDLRDEMSNILTNTSVDEDRIFSIQSVLTMSIDLLEMDNDALDGTFAISFAAALVAVPWLLIGMACEKLEKELLNLRKALEKAEKEETEAIIKGVFAGAITAATLLLPQVGLMVRVSLSLGQVGLDFMLEGPKQSTVREVGGKVAPIAEQVADGIADIDRLSPSAKTFTKGASKGVSGLGLYFNAVEVGTAWENVEKIEAAIKKAEKAHTRLMKVLKANKMKYLFFMNKFGKGMDAIQNVWGNATELRSSLYEEMADTGYDP